MNDQEYKRLKRLVLRFFAVTLAIIVAVAFWGSWQLRTLNAQLATYTSSPPKETLVIREKPLPAEVGINGMNGSNGQDGAGTSGRAGLNGKDGTNVTPDQIAQAVATYLQANPPKTIRGPIGLPGLVVYVQQNPLTGLLECRHGTDTIWQPITECSL